MGERSSGGTWKEGSGKNMKHPNQATLALHAGGDLGFLARWRTSRHLARCEQCRDEVVAFEALREILPELGGNPGSAVEPTGGGDEGQYPSGVGSRRVCAVRQTRPCATSAVYRRPRRGRAGQRHGPSRHRPHARAPRARGGRPKGPWCRPPPTEFRSAGRTQAIAHDEQRRPARDLFPGRAGLA